MWAVAEVVRPDLVRSLTVEEVQADWNVIWNIIETRKTSSPEEAEALFGPFPVWQNPDYGNPGNIHHLCLQCFNPIEEQGKCSSCNPSVTLAQAASPVPQRPAESEADQAVPFVMFFCPRCRRLTDSLKYFKLFEFFLFLLVFGAGAQGAYYKACPSCMRKVILKKLTLINIIPANLAWPVIFVIHAVYFAKTYQRGHSKEIIGMR